jgi:hypothetical protein
LEDLAARRMAEFVDMFNVLPILIFAERVQNDLLIRSVMDCYLTEQVVQMATLSQNRHDEYETREEQDSQGHPIFKDFILGVCKATSATTALFFVSHHHHHPTTSL